MLYLSSDCGAEECIPERICVSRHRRGEPNSVSQISPRSYEWNIRSGPAGALPPYRYGVLDESIE